MELQASYIEETNRLKSLFSKSSINSDLCEFKGNYYIRGVLEIPIVNSDEVFTWGVWVSQSKENFVYYKKNYSNSNLRRETFGWFSNTLPYYENTLNIKTNIVFQEHGERPKIELEKTDNELSQDFYNGIDEKKASKIAEISYHNFQQSVEGR